VKITGVRAHCLASALETPFAFSQGWVKSRGACLVELQTDEGLTGWGEALCQGLQPPQIAAAAIEHSLAPLLTVGLQGERPERDQWAISDVAGLARAHFGLSPPASRPRLRQGALR